MKRFLTKRTAGVFVLFLVIGFYTVGTGFQFFYQFLYTLALMGVIGIGWALLSLRGIDIQLSRITSRGQAGEYLEGRVSIRNTNRLPKSWLEVSEFTDLPGNTPGRGIAMVKDQARTWRTETYLSRRGLYHVGQVEVVGQDPLGIFRFRRLFGEPEPFIVFPATEPLPDLDLRLANLPSESRTSHYVSQITTDVSSVREYVHGDSFRRIHWPYTARMNTLMVKEFDLGQSADAWVLLDMQRSSHPSSNDESDNTEELGVTIAASLISKLVELSMPVGLASNSDNTYIFRPDSSPEHQGRLFESLAQMRANGSVSLERYLYDLRGQLSRFNTLTVITPSAGAEWVPALNDLRRKGVNVAVVLIDPQEFGGSREQRFLIDYLFDNDIGAYIAKRGQSLNEALRIPLGRRESVVSETRQASVTGAAG